jgi:hypothetical protein
MKVFHRIAIKVNQEADLRNQPIKDLSQQSKSLKI